MNWFHVELCVFQHRTLINLSPSEGRSITSGGGMMVPSPKLLLQRTQPVCCPMMAIKFASCYWLLATTHVQAFSATEPRHLNHRLAPLTSRHRLALSDRLTSQEEVEEEAREKLNNMGWALPTEGDLTADDPFVQAIDAGIQEDVGVPLDGLLNPAKVVNLERDLYELREQLATLTGRNWQAILKETEGQAISTDAVDGGGGGDDAEAIRAKIAKKEGDLAIERRSVFRGWLKNVFLVQAILSFGISYVMATNPSALFGQFGWFYSYNMDVSIQVLGYWWWWLFVVPSLRSRRPKGAEKNALDIAFLGTPLISLVAPAATKDTGIIWALNFAVVLGAYGYAFLLDNDDTDDSSSTPEWLKFVYKSLDFGSGRERGARK